MGTKTNISWTDSSWNPWRGCRKVSPGCARCYMYRDAARYGHDPRMVARSKTTFKDPLKWKEPRKIFTCSWSDFFIREADAWRDEAWDIIRRTPQHTYQILTKRTDRIADHLPADWGQGYPNVWLIVTTENQAMANKRIPELLRVPAVLHGLSVEPLLGPVDLFSIPFRGDTDYYINPLAYRYSQYPIDNADSGTLMSLGMAGLGRIDWVIVGGESGPDFRPMDLDWARALRDQCAAARVAFFYKQGSGRKPGTDPHLDGIEIKQFPGES